MAAWDGSSGQYDELMTYGINYLNLWKIKPAMETIIIRPKNKASLDLYIMLAKQLGGKINLINDKALEDALLVADIEDGIKSGLLGKEEKEAFLKEIKVKSKR
jgi:hypothetical protein